VKLVAPPPLVVFVIGIAVAILNLMTLSVPGDGANAAGYLAGYLATPLIIALLYWAWYRRRHREP
jgi:hypothetical protein